MTYEYTSNAFAGEVLFVEKDTSYSGYRTAVIRAEDGGLVVMMHRCDNGMFCVSAEEVQGWADWANVDASMVRISCCHPGKNLNTRTGFAMDAATWSDMPFAVIGDWMEETFTYLWDEQGTCYWSAAELTVGVSYCFDPMSSIEWVARFGN